MCFYSDDYDWYAEHIDLRASPGGDVTKCGECDDTINAHKWRIQIHMRESGDECLRCDGDVDGEDACDCEDGPDLGQEYDVDRCRRCVALLAAIRRQERDEECPQHAQQPGIGELGDVFTEHESAAVYAQRAVRLFPSLRDHKFVLAALK